MAGWSIFVCPKCHTLGAEGRACPNGCTRSLNREESLQRGTSEAPIRCIGIDVVPTALGSVALINASAKPYPVV